ncbi:MAG: tetratricopeptide repeat protein [Gemmataceae bacterium]
MSGAAVVTVATLIGVGNARLVEQRNLAEEKRKEAEANAEAADAQRRRAVAHLRRAREAVERMLTRVGHDRLAPAPYTMKVREELLEDAVQLYQQMAQEEESDLEILYEVGRSLRRLGQLQGGRGQRQQAEQSYRRAVHVFEKLTALEPNQPAHRKELAASYNNLSTALDQIKNADAEPLLRRALAMQEKLAEDHPEHPDYLLDALVTKGNLGDLFYLKKRTEPALQYWKESIAGLEKLAAAAPKEREYHFRLAAGLLNQGSYLARLGRLDEAEPIFRRAVAAFEPLADGPTADLGSRGRLAMSCFNLGLLLSNRGNASEGERHLRRAAEIRRKMTREHPEVARYHADLGAILHRLGYVVRGQGDVAAAIRIWEDGIEHHRAALKATPEDANAEWLLGLDCWNVADGHLRLGDHRKAAEAAAGLPPDNRIAWETQARGAFLLARCSAVAAKDTSLPADGRQARAREYADQAVELLRQAVGKGYQDLPYLQKDPMLDVLRPRADFQRLLAELAARKKDG